ncbi:hypothetical protein AN958_02370 [Leucoagaricus sp. SymC.cos]|nr:hypothetical protein AN958_02370 [Leucoagaricus sp. SymC.cos]
MPQPKIRVFWDLETCPPPTSSYTSPWEILKDVRLFTGHFGIVTSIRAYWDSKKTRRGTDNSINTESFRDAIPSMGVHAVDCSLAQGYSGDALTRLLTADVLISAIDEPNNSDTTPQDIIMILSGDDGIIYPISLLMFRNYIVFLVVPDEADNVQQFQATRIFRWHQDVLGFKLEETPTKGLKRNDGALGFRNARQRAPTTSLDTTPAIAPPIHSALSGAVKPDVTHSPTSRDDFDSHLASELLESRAASVLGSHPRKLSYASATATDVRTPSKPEQGSDIRYQMYSQVSLSQEDLEPNYGTGAHGDWEMGSSSGWNAGEGLEIDPWRPEPANDSKKTQGEKKYRLKETVDGPDSSSHPDMTVEVQSETPKEVPISVFDPLLQVLREAKRRSMGRSKLGETLARNKGIYKTAGVKGFAEYIALAVAKDLVIAGGVDNNQYVRLHPKLKNTQ